MGDMKCPKTYEELTDDCTEYDAQVRINNLELELRTFKRNVSETYQRRSDAPGAEAVTNDRRRLTKVQEDSRHSWLLIYASVLSLVLLLIVLFNGACSSCLRQLAPKVKVDAPSHHTRRSTGYTATMREVL